MEKNDINKLFNNFFSIKHNAQRFNKNNRNGILLPEINIHMRKKIEVIENNSINFFLDKSLKKNKEKIANKLNF